MTLANQSSTWVDLLQHRADNMADRMAYTFVEADGSQLDLSYAGLDEQACRQGAALQQFARPGDRILILLPSCLSYVSVYFASLYAGCIPVTGYPPRAGQLSARVLGIIDDCSPSVIVADANTYEHLKAQQQSGDLKFAGAVLNVDQLGADFTRNDFKRVSDPSPLALLQYTSGSTSTPKGVMVTHGNLMHNCELLSAGMGFTEESIVASWLPLHHDMGLIGKILCSIYARVPCYFIAPVTFIKSPYLWLKLISDHRCTISGAPNFAFDQCVQRVSDEEKSQLDLSSWRVAWNGAEHVRNQTLCNFYDAFAATGLKREALHPCYGLAEATLFVSAQQVDHEPVSCKVDTDSLSQGILKPAEPGSARTLEYVSIGQPRLDTLIKIVDPVTHAECPESQVGEIWTSSPSVAIGYWENPEATAKTFGARLADDDGHRYMRTGDLGVSLAGEIYLTGRIKDVFIFNGRNVYPQDVESTLDLTHPVILRSAVFEFLDNSKRADDISRICAVCEADVKGLDYSEADLDELCVKLNAAVQVEHEIALDTICLVRRGSIPKTSSGKVQRAASRKAYLGDELRVVHQWQPRRRHEPTAAPAPVEQSASGLQQDIYQLLKQQVARLTKLDEADIKPDRRLSEFGLSSLQLHELQFGLEQALNRSLDEVQFYNENPTFAELAARLAGQSSGSVDSAETYAELPPVLLMQNKYQQSMEQNSHPFLSAMNPEFGRRLAQLKLDKEFVRAEGLYLYDANGNQYLDFLAQYGAVPFGHNHPAIWQAVTEFQQAQLPAMVQPSLLHVAGQLAERLAQLAPGDVTYTTFSNSGAEAIEAAIKLCRSTTGRRRILATKNGFHGKTLGALSATGRDKYRKHFAVSDEFDHVPYNDLPALREALATRRYAGFIVEPIQGEAGVIVPASGYLRKVQELCRETGTLFICDEVQTGLGRTGTLFYSEQQGVEPDIITLAKGLGGGLAPIGACLASRRIYNDEFGNKHTSTFAGNGLACAIGLRSLELLLENDGQLLCHVSEIGKRLKSELIVLQRKHLKLVKEVRGVGLMLAVHVDIDRYRFGSGLLAAVSEEDFLTSLLMSYLLNHEQVRVAFTLNDGNVLRVQPPLTVTWEDCEIFLAALDRTLTVLASGNMAQMAGHLVDLSADEIPDSPTYEEDFVEPVHTRDSNAFGFLLHPLTPKTYVDFDISLTAFDRDQLIRIGHIFGDNFEPFLGGENQLISDTGDKITGEFWVVPRTAHDLITMPRPQALMEVQEAMDNAVRGGASIVGLGAYTSTVTQGGLLLNTPDDLAVTTGNTYTTLVGFQSVIEVFKREQRPLADQTIAIVGATGSIGRALALLFGSFVKRLILVGNPSNHKSSVERMRRICKEMIDYRSPIWSSGLPHGELHHQLEQLSKNLTADAVVDQLCASGALVLTTDWDESLPQADVIVTATNSPDAWLQSSHLKQGAVICDISRPSNVCEEIAQQRPDIFIYDGGVVRLPAGSFLGLHTDLDPGHCYACMAETMLISLEANPDLAVRGMEVDMERISVFGALARKHGFEVYIPERAEASLSGMEASAL
ncbi:MAG: hypothetical protein Tsb002_00310 [Wenzhouxiangellaceae bacterium]